MHFNKTWKAPSLFLAKKELVKIGGQYLNELEYQCIEGYTIDAIEKGNPPNQYGFYTGSMSNHDKVYDDIVQAMHRKSNSLASAADGLKTVEIIEKIYTVMRNQNN